MCKTFSYLHFPYFCFLLHIFMNVSMFVSHSCMRCGSNCFFRSSFLPFTALWGAAGQNRSPSVCPTFDRQMVKIQPNKPSELSKRNLSQDIGLVCDEQFQNVLPSLLDSIPTSHSSDQQTPMHRKELQSSRILAISTKKDHLS